MWPPSKAIVPLATLSKFHSGCLSQIPWFRELACPTPACPTPAYPTPAYPMRACPTAAGHHQSRRAGGCDGSYPSPAGCSRCCRRAVTCRAVTCQKGGYSYEPLHLYAAPLPCTLASDRRGYSLSDASHSIQCPAGRVAPIAAVALRTERTTRRGAAAAQCLCGRPARRCGARPACLSPGHFQAFARRDDGRGGRCVERGPCMACN